MTNLLYWKRSTTPTTVCSTESSTTQNIYCTRFWLIGNLRQRPYGNKTLLEKHHHSTTRISSSELCTDTVTNPHSMTQPLLSTYSKLLLTLHIHFFQFHVLYAAYVGYLIKRIWYGCCFIGYFSRSFFVLSFTLNTVGRLVTFPYEVSFESPSLQIRGWGQSMVCVHTYSESDNALLRYGYLKFSN